MNDPLFPFSCCKISNCTTDARRGMAFYIDLIETGDFLVDKFESGNTEVLPRAQAAA